MDWKSLGVNLDIRYSKLEEIDVNNCSQVQDCKYGLVEIRRCMFLEEAGLHALAEGIRGKYCPLYQG